MGASSGARQRKHKPKAPASAPMGNLSLIAPQFVAPGSTTLVLREKMFTGGDSAKVVDAAGKLVFEIEIKHATMSTRRMLKDAQGVVIGTVRRQRTPNVHNTTYLGTMDDEKKCVIKCKGTTNATRTLSATELGVNLLLGQNAIGHVVGNWKDKSFHISIFGNRIARISKEAAGLTLDANSYCVEIAPKVDSAFVTMIIVALDEIYPED